MSTTQIPPTGPASSTPPPRSTGGRELYDARYWESAYREIDQAPTLLLHLQDEVTRTRRREAFWISVVVHLMVVLLIVNSDRLASLMPRRSVVVANPNLTPHDKDVTFLELPPDEQKLTKRPNTNIISDKDRIATSKAPQIDRQELKRILDAARPGRPGPSGTPSPDQQPAPQASAQNAPPAPQQGAPQAPPSNQNMVAKLQPPPLSAKNAFA